GADVDGADARPGDAVAYTAGGEASELARIDVHRGAAVQEYRAVQGHDRRVVCGQARGAAGGPGRAAELRAAVDGHRGVVPVQDDAAGDGGGGGGKRVAARDHVAAAVDGQG